MVSRLPNIKAPEWPISPGPGIDAIDWDLFALN